MQGVDSQVSNPTKKLVLVEWVDSAQPLPNWRFLDNLPPLDAVICRSVGWLVGETKTVKMLAPNIGLADDGTFEQASGFIRIPTRCIKSMRQIK